MYFRLPSFVLLTFLFLSYQRAITSGPVGPSGSIVGTKKHSFPDVFCVAFRLVKDMSIWSWLICIEDCMREFC